MQIMIATSQDEQQLRKLDHHITPDVLTQKIARGEILVACVGSTIAGWLRYGYFWDTIPFMNMLTVVEPMRGRGTGTHLIVAWERLMRERGFRQVLTSTLSNERAQFLYRKLGYQDCGALLLPGEPLEILLRKEL